MHAYVYPGLHKTSFHQYMLLHQYLLASALTKLTQSDVVHSIIMVTETSKNGHKSIFSPPG